ncbi:MFS transporter [Prauserella alba]|uniref:MFS transporter n=1 Tax=Prauserella alba TaxID=176898 RepID=UPI0020A36199|nr:MFS transporter [Prauserella alba]MCP2178942.1 putative arabinose efflux permease, MFS family [Prauserella alba]
MTQATSSSGGSARTGRHRPADGRRPVSHILADFAVTGHRIDASGARRGVEYGGRHRTPHRRGAYIAMQIAFAINLAGNAIGAAGFPIFVLDSTGDLALTGWIVTVSMVGSIITGVVAGPLIDRAGLRVSWIFSIVVGTALTALTYALFVAGVLAPWLLLGVSFLRNSADEPGRVATFGLLPTLAKQAGHSLESANATLRSMNALATIFGPMVAGGIVAAFGSPWVLVVDAAAGALAAVIVIVFLAVPGSAAAEKGRTAADLRTYRQQFVVAVRFFRYDKLLLSLIITTTILATLDSAVGTIGLTGYASDILDDAAWYGGLVSAFGIGSLIGTITYGVVGARLPRRATYLAAYLGFAAMLLLLTVQVHVVAALAIMVVGGIMISPIDLLYLQVLQERVPERIFGSVTSIVTTIVSGPGPVGVAMLTWLLGAAGTRTTFVVIGCCYLLIAVVLFFVRPLHRLKRPRFDDAQPTQPIMIGSLTR